MKAGRFQEALVIFQAAVAKDPKDLKASQLLANCLAKMGRLDEAQKVIERSRKAR
jgi:Flp pilus assembly protein TadD